MDLIEQSLKEWAKDNGMSYSKAYRMHKKGKIQNTKVVKGDIMVMKAAQITNNKVGFQNKPVYSTNAGTVGHRTNRSAQSEPDDNYSNIGALYDAAYDTYGGNSNESALSISDIISLTRKAYKGLPQVRRTINTLKEFSASKIYLTDGNEKSRSFYNAWLNAIGFDSFENSFFLEFWRSANCFIYKINGKLKDESIKKLKETYGFESLAKTMEIPVKYVILNPEDIVCEGTAFFSNPTYYKRFNSYEVAQLKKRQTEIDKAIYNSLPDVTRKQIDQKNIGAVNVELKSDQIRCVFLDKQDYESFGVSPIYPVLDDLEHKLELKKIDRAIAKTCQQSVLHVAMGYENKNGEYFFNEEAAAEIEEIFSGEEVGKVLITDFTAKLQFVIPQIGELLDPKKYEVVDRDIHEGLMDILFGGGSGEKFSNLTVKIKVFVEKIRKARESFLNEFLIPEMTEIGKKMGFKQIPTPHFEDIDIEDNINFYKIITRLAEIGVLTPEEVFQSFENGRMPTPEESVISQMKFKELKDKEFYIPLLNAGKEKEAGRPGGSTGVPQATKAPPTKASVNLTKFAEILNKQIEFKNKIASSIKKQIKKDLTIEQLDAINSLANHIILNEPINTWESKVSEYQKEEKITEQKAKIEKIASEYNVGLNTASTIFHAQNCN